MQATPAELQKASLNLGHTLSIVDLPGRINGADALDHESIAPPPHDQSKPSRLQEEDNDYYQIPSFFEDDEDIQRTKLIQDFLEDIQATVRAQVCSIFLVDDTGNLRRNGITGFDRNGAPIREDQYSQEEYPLDGTSAVSKAAQPTDGRYGHYIYIESVHDHCPDFVRSDKLKDHEAICGRIDAAVFIPIHGPNRSYGVLRVFNKVSDDKRPIYKAAFTSEEQIYLAQAAAYLGSNLRELRKNQDQEFALVLQNNILLKWAEINRQVLGYNANNDREVHQEILSTYRSILRHLACPPDSHVKSAILRLIGSDNKLTHVASYTRDEDGYKDNMPRTLPPLDRDTKGVYSLVGAVAQTGKDRIVRDITSPDSLGLFVNQAWIESNNLQDFLCIALKANDNIIGTLSLFTGKNRCLALEDLRYLKGISSSIGLYTSLIFSSPNTPRGQINQEQLERFLESFAPPSPSINLRTLRLEEALPSPVFDPYFQDPTVTDEDNVYEEEDEAGRVKRISKIFISHEKDNKSQADFLASVLSGDHIKPADGTINPLICTSSSRITNEEWENENLESFQVYILLLSDQSAYNQQLRMNEWASINAEIWKNPLKKLIPIRISGTYLPAFLSNFTVLDGSSSHALEQAASRILTYPDAEHVASAGVMDEQLQSEMVKRYTDLFHAIFQTPSSP